ncbi:MAG TPA: alanine racemase [Thermotogota bacterium]|nr:alanine racemase [Thermotogota bacterium]HPJ88877.1 alanine racemase [Thermotogota bacterium]HPR96161.1 alanine racemase [Thermotogota bacterium]
MYRTEGDYRKTCVSISTDAYRHNLEYFASKCNPSKVAPVIKADAYGHGAVELGLIAQEMGMELMVVAFLSEAIELREEGIKADILILNYFDARFVDLLIKYDLTATVYSVEQYEALNAQIEEGVLKAHVILDTGMSRVGFDYRHCVEAIRGITKNEKFDITGIYTHFAVADDVNALPELLSFTDEKEVSEFTRLQYERFRSVAERLPEIRMRHCANSAASLFFADDFFDYVRVGIASYGMDPRSEKREGALQPVLTWQTCVSMVKYIEVGTSVSYGRTFVAEERMKVASIPVGYADGYNRLLSNNGDVLINGSRCPILGRVCMDQFVVDVSHAGEVKMGDEVVLLGRMGEEEITAEEMAQKVNTINYEITCDITKRVIRRYI